jgi:hypothetical protein
MTRYSKFNIVYRLQKWMDSVPGQTFLNYAYSWGASIVILGTLFKLTHLPGANFFLFLGMGTEVFVFFISAFDRPFDKTADGMDLPTHLREHENEEESEVPTDEEGNPIHVEQGGIVGGTGGGTIIIGGGGGSGIATGAVGEESGVVVNGGSVGAVGGGGFVGGGVIGGVVDPNVAAVLDTEALASKSISEEMTEATNSYVEQLKELTEVLEKVSEQSRRLTTDSEEMENLNRTLTGICKIYEMQLKTASSQIGTTDEINAQMKRMASQIEELNRIYTRMIEAMTVNMPGGAVPPANS